MHLNDESCVRNVMDRLAVGKQFARSNRRWTHQERDRDRHGPWGSSANSNVPPCVWRHRGERVENGTEIDRVVLPQGWIDDSHVDVDRQHFAIGVAHRHDHVVLLKTNVWIAFHDKGTARGHPSTGRRIDGTHDRVECVSKVDAQILLTFQKVKIWC